MAELITVRQLQQRLRISKQRAYDLCREPGFPVCHVGRKILIPADRLQEWIDRGGSKQKEPA